MAAFRPPDNKNLRTDVANEIIRAIAEGELKAGDRIVEQHISEQMGISRAPIREALRELDGQGIVITVDRKGAFVASLAREDVEELMTLRRILEGLAAKTAASRIVEADLLQLAKYIEDMSVAAARSDARAFIESDLLFHHLVCERSGLKWLQRMLEGPQTLIRLLVTMAKYSKLAEDQLAAEAEAHRPIISALAAHDANGAETAVHEHVSHVMSYLSTHLRSRDDQAG